MGRLFSLVIFLALVAAALIVVDRLVMDGEWSARFGVDDEIERVWPREAAAPETPVAETGPSDGALAAPLVIAGFSSPESVVYDAQYDRYLVGNVGGREVENDGFIAALYPDGSVQDMAFITGAADAPLNNPLGTAVHDGALYVADSPYVRVYDLETGAHIVSHLIEGEPILLNDLDVAGDGTIYVTSMGTENVPATWAVFTISPDGDVSQFASGADLMRPNGLELDDDGRVVLAVVAAPQLVILNNEGLVEQTISLPDGGYDGVVLLDDGYITSAPRMNAIYRVGLDGVATPIGDGAILSPASLGFDPTRNRLLIPQLAQNTVTLLDLN